MIRVAAFIVTLFLMDLTFTSQAQKVYTIDASNVTDEIKAGHLKMGDPGLAGKEILVNNRYMTLGATPIVPVMGEIHFSRVPKDQWEDMILKMKAAGINIIATYVFWVHHEEIEGQFDWSGNKDFRYFLQICQKHGLWAYPRIGPWCHGEVRNGGTPDWILSRKFLTDRSNDPVYQTYVKLFYSQIAAQMKGLLYKDGGPVIGIQLENEYSRRGEGQGEAHILWLKQTARNAGLDVPMYTITGWDNAVIPEKEVIPLWGAYADYPWEPNLERRSACDAFQFKKFRGDNNIGNEHSILKNGDSDYEMYPFFTCEIGIGIMNTNHRRLNIGKIDGAAMVTAKIGSGSNMPGYYVFAGGSNPRGILTSMEENQDETGYYNKNPEVSYDFQAAIKESGDISPAYHEVKKLHYFLNEFGDRLAPATPVTGAPVNDLQYSVRVNNNSGFLFGINYCRWNLTPERKYTQFNIKLSNENLTFPSLPVNIPDSAVFVWPFNFKMDNLMLKYATSQPLCRIEQKDQILWVFIQDVKNVSPEFCFEASSLNKIEATNGNLKDLGDRTIINGLKPGADCYISIWGKNSKPVKVLVLSDDESKKTWLLKNKDDKYLFISSSNMYIDHGRLTVYGPSNSIKFKYTGSNSDGFSYKGLPAVGKNEGLFRDYEFTLPEKKISIDLKARQVFEGASFLKTSFDAVNKENFLYHRFFLKEFTLNNPSKVKSAKVYLISDDKFRLQVSDTWVNQPVFAGKINMIDITGYVHKGANSIMLQFPAGDGEKSFAARVIVEYFNTDRIEFFSDQSWLTLDSYLYPSILRKCEGFKAPQVVTGKNDLSQIIPDFCEYKLKLPENYSLGLKNVYLKINYEGDKARCRINHLLVADDFNSNVPWQIGLGRLGNQTEIQDLSFEIYPLAPDYRVYFDNPPAKENIGRAEIKDVRLIPEYSIELGLQGKN